MSVHEFLIPHPYSSETKATLEAELVDLDAAVAVAETPAETRSGFETATAALTPRSPEEWLERADRLQWVQATSAGYDDYDLEALEAAGVALTTASGVHAQSIGEQVLGALLAFERNLLRARDQQRDGLWHRYDSGELGRKTVGIVGLGAIGTRVAELAGAVGATVIGTKRDPADGPDAADEVHPPDELQSLLPRVDYLVLACPLTPETRGLIDEAALETMSDGAILVNVARGEVVVEEALVTALQRGELAGAALDVFAEEPLPDGSPLWDLPNVLVTPHVAGSTPAYYERVAEIVRENFERFAAGDLEGMRNRVV